MDNVIIETSLNMDKVIEAMLKKFANVRAGRASTAILDDVMVSYYGVDTPLIQLATISVPEARQIVIKPFDKSSISNIEKAIYEANLGLTPNNNGEQIVLVFPPLTEERRKEFVKQVKEMSEEAKIALRNVRQEANTEIKNSDLPEDLKKDMTNEVQELIQEYNKKVEKLLKDKEEELLTI